MRSVSTVNMKPTCVQSWIPDRLYVELHSPAIYSNRSVRHSKTDAWEITGSIEVFFFHSHNRMSTFTIRYDSK